MGLFGKKKPAEQSEQEVQPVTPSKKKKKDTIGSVLHESVLENVLEELRENKLFIADVDGQSVYVTLALAAADIGGLSKSTAKGNEAKGSIIECINSGRIKAIVTQELIDMDMFLIIPDVLTMDAMDEFGLLTGVDYKLAYVNPEDGISVTEHVVAFDRVKDMVDNDISVSELLAELTGDAPATTARRAKPASDDGLDGFGASDFDDMDDDDDGGFGFSGGDNVDGFDDDDDDFDADDDDDGFGGSDLSVPFSDDDTDDDSDDSDYSGDMDGIFGDSGRGTAFDDHDGASGADSGFDDSDATDFDSGLFADGDYSDESDSDDGAVDSDDHISEEQMHDAIVRVFYSDGLGMEATTAPFDAQFMQDDNIILFDENRDTSGEGGWLAGYLNQMSKDANNELMRLHQQNLMSMRTQYFQLISLHCEKIQRDLDTSDGETQFGKLMDSLKRQRLQALGSVDRLVADRKQEVNSSWEQTLTRVGEEARNAAIQQYSERYGRQHEDQLSRIEPEIKRQIEDQYQDAVREMQASRKSEASKLLDYGITETLRVITDSYLDLLRNEQALYETHRQRMAAFVDDHRQTEIARANALAEELRQTDKADAARREGKARIEQLNAEFDAKKAAQQAELDAMRRANAQAIADKEAECNNRIKALNEVVRAKDEEIARIQGQYRELLGQFTDVDARKGQEYESRINELKQERLAWQDKYDNTIAMQKRNNTISVLLVVVAMVASLAIGMIFGMKSNIDSRINDARTNITSSQTQQDNVVAQGEGAVIDMPDNA